MRLAAGIVLTAVGLLLFLYGVFVFALLELVLAAGAFWLGLVELDAARSQPPRA